MQCENSNTFHYISTTTPIKKKNKNKNTVKNAWCVLVTPFGNEVYAVFFNLPKHLFPMHL